MGKLAALPKLLSLRDVRDLQDLARRTGEWGSAAQDLLRGLRQQVPDLERRITELENNPSGGSGSIPKLDDLMAPDDNTDLNASTSAHGLMQKYPGGTTDFLRADGSWAEPPGSGGSTFPLWVADLPPSSPHSDDDEFDDSSISGSWSTWDPASYLSFAEGSEGLQFSGTGNGTNRWGGKYKAVPASEFSAVAKLILGSSQLGGAATAIALFCSDNLSSAPTTADFRQIENIASVSGLSQLIISRTWNAYNGGTSITTQTSATPQVVYVRIRVNGTSMWTDYSYDGLWWKIHSAVTLGFTPAHYGISFEQNDNGLTGDAYCRFFRVASGSGASAFSALVPGQYANISYT